MFLSSALGFLVLDQPVPLQLQMVDLTVNFQLQVKPPRACIMTFTIKDQTDDYAAPSQRFVLSSYSLSITPENYNVNQQIIIKGVPKYYDRNLGSSIQFKIKASFCDLESQTIDGVATFYSYVRSIIFGDPHYIFFDKDDLDLAFQGWGTYYLLKSSMVYFFNQG